MNEINSFCLRSSGFPHSLSLIPVQSPEATRLIAYATAIQSLAPQEQGACCSLLYRSCNYFLDCTVELILIIFRVCESVFVYFCFTHYTGELSRERAQIEFQRIKDEPNSSLYAFLHPDGQLRGIPSSCDPFAHVSMQEMVDRLEKDVDPSGYFPLDHNDPAYVPIGYNAFEQGLFGVDASQSPLNPFEGSDVQIIPDDQLIADSLRQMHTSEAHAFKALFNEIARGRTKIQIDQEPRFRGAALECIKKMMTRPASRFLILTLTRASETISFVPADKSSCECMLEQNTVKISLNLFNLGFDVCHDSSGKKVFERFPDYIVMIHEIVHALHFLTLRNLDSYQEAQHLLKLYSMKPHVPTYSSLEEQWAIAGSHGARMICENMTRKEFDLRPREGHHTPPPAIAALIQERRYQTLTPIQLKNCVVEASYFHMTEVIEELILAGASLRDACMGAILGGHMDLIQAFQNRGVGIQNSSPAMLQHLINKSVDRGYVKVLEYFEGLGIDLQVTAVRNDAWTESKNKYTNWTLLHRAVLNGQTKMVDFLLSRGADLHLPMTGINYTSWQTWMQSPLRTAIVEGNPVMVDHLLRCGAQPNQGDFYLFWSKAATETRQPQRILYLEQLLFPSP